MCLKNQNHANCLKPLRLINEKGVYINDLVSGKLLRSIKYESPADFSKKELDFLKLCCSELTYKEIAEQMFVSPRTVDNYREALFLKLNIKIKNRACSLRNSE